MPQILRVGKSLGINGPKCEEFATVYTNHVSSIREEILLDPSAAFDTVDHDILMDRLENWFGFSGTVLDWLQSYLSGRKSFVTIGDHTVVNIIFP